jgi:hypothetical protein
MREFQYIIVETIIALATFSLNRDEKKIKGLVYLGKCCFEVRSWLMRRVSYYKLIIVA